MTLFLVAGSVGVTTCSFDDLTREESPIDRVVIVDVDGRRWDITQAVHLYGFNAGGFSEGFGAFTVVPVLNPPLVAAGDSNYPADGDTFAVVGVVLDGTARAYAIDTLASVEVVNDVHAQMLSAVVYDPPSGTTGAYLRSIDGDPVTLAASGWRYGGRSVLFDYETESLWYRLGGSDGLTCINGERLNSFLEPITAARLPWNMWRTMNPTTAVFGAPSP